MTLCAEAWDFVRHSLIVHARKIGQDVTGLVERILYGASVLLMGLVIPPYLLTLLLLIIGDGLMRLGLSI